MEQVCGYYILLVLVLLFVNIKYGLLAYLAYFFLVPFLQVKIGISLSYNLVNAVIFLALFWSLRIKHQQIDIIPIKPYLIFYGFFFLLIPIQFDTPYIEQLNSFRVSFMLVIFLPLAIWNVIQMDYKNVRWFEAVIIFCIIVACLYGLLLTQTPGFNPYIMSVMEITGGDYDFEWLLDAGSGRLFGRISSVFLHPMTFGFFLGLSMVFLYSLLDRWNKILIISILVLVSINLVTCGVRSVIGGISVAFIYYVLKGKNYKLLLYFSLFALLTLIAIGVNSDTFDYINSISSSDSEGVSKGSSIELRINQLEGVFYEIRDCFIQGKGYGWTTYYLDKNLSHPVILAFESLIFVVLCDSGLLGVAIWGQYLRNSYRVIQDLAGDKSTIIESLFVFYLSYACITGEYSYMKYFVIFHIVMLGGSIYQNSILTDEKEDDGDNSILPSSVSSVQGE